MAMYLAYGSLCELIDGTVPADLVAKGLEWYMKIKLLLIDSVATVVAVAGNLVVDV